MDDMKKVSEEKEFVEKVLKMQPEDAVVAFNERGIECTVEDLMQAKQAIDTICASKEEALSEEDLAGVVGGGKIGEFIVGAVGGLLVGGGVYGLAALGLISW